MNTSQVKYHHVQSGTFSMYQSTANGYIISSLRIKGSKIRKETQNVISSLQALAYFSSLDGWAMCMNYLLYTGARAADSETIGESLESAEKRKHVIYLW